MSTYRGATGTLTGVPGSVLTARFGKVTLPLGTN